MYSDAQAEVHLVEREAGELDSRLSRASLARNSSWARLRSLMSIETPINRSGSPADVRRARPRDDTQRGPSPRKDAVFRGDGFRRPPGALHGSLKESPVVGMDDSQEAVHVDDLVWREPEDGSSLFGEPEDPIAVVEHPEPRTGGDRRHGEALLALPQRDIRALAGQRIGEDLCHQLQALHHRLGPIARFCGGVEAQSADRRRAAHRERHSQIRLDPKHPEILAVEGGRFGEVIERSGRDDSAGQHLSLEPGEVLPRAHAAHRREQILAGAVEVGQYEGAAGPR